MSYVAARAEKFYNSYTDLSQIASIADKLRWCRNRAGLLQRDVAAYAVITHGAYSDYEMAKKGAYPIEMIKKAPNCT